MEKLGFFNERTINYQYYTNDIDWANTMPVKNWLLLIIADEKSVEKLDEIVSQCVTNGICYACCTGKQGSLLENMIDDKWLVRSQGLKEGYYLPLDILMTSRHDTLDDALWFSIFCADNEPGVIDVVFCIDASENFVKEELKDLINQYTFGKY